MEKTRKPAQKLLLLACVLLLCAGAVALAVARPWEPQPEHLYQLDPAEVTGASLRNANKATRMDIADPRQVSEIVELLNSFTYQSAEDFPPASGWSYYLDLHTPAGTQEINFGADYIRVWHRDGSSTFYFGPEGHFQKLVDLAESATDPL